MENKQTQSAPARRIGPWPVMILVVAGTWLIARTSSDAEPIYCGINKDADQADVVMLSATWCGYCRKARHFFVSEAINYCEHDIENSPTGRRLYQQSEIKVVPIIRVKDDLIVGFSKNELKQSLASHDLYPLEKL